MHVRQHMNARGIDLWNVVSYWESLHGTLVLYKRFPCESHLIDKAMHKTLVSLEKQQVAEWRQANTCKSCWHSNAFRGSRSHWEYVHETFAQGACRWNSNDWQVVREYSDKRRGNRVKSDLTHPDRIQIHGENEMEASVFGNFVCHASLCTWVVSILKIGLTLWAPPSHLWRNSRRKLLGRGWSMLACYTPWRLNVKCLPLVVMMMTSNMVVLDCGIFSCIFCTAFLQDHEN